MKRVLLSLSFILFLSSVAYGGEMQWLRVIEDAKHHGKTYFYDEIELGGNAADEISTDGELADNSDSALPTEQAVKTYVDHERIGTPTYYTHKQAFDVFVSPGRISGGEITDAGSQTINVAAGSGVIRIADDDVSTLKFFDWSAASGQSVPTDTTKFIGIEYNAGSPQVVLRSASNWDLDTEFSLGLVANIGDELHIISDPWWTGDAIANVIERFEGQGIERDERIKGILLGETGTRYVTLTSGTLWFRLNEHVISAMDTTPTGDVFGSYYYNGSAWIKTSSLTQWPNTQYNNTASGLVDLGAQKYASLWWFISLDGHLVMLYGQDDYSTLAAAHEEDPPSSLPGEAQYGSVLAGRFIFQKSEGTTEVIESAFGGEYQAGAVSHHGSLSGLTDDDHTQYWNDERGQDGIAALLQNGQNLTWTYDDDAPTLTADVTVNAGDTYTNFGVGSDDTVDELYAAIDSAWPSVVSPGGSDTQVQFNASGSFDGDAAFIWDDTNKRLGVGMNAPLARLHVWGVDEDTASIIIGETSDDFIPGNIFFHKARDAGGAVENIDYLGSIRFGGWDGDEYVYGAGIFAQVEGTPGDDDMPTRLAFYTTPDGSDTWIERMAIGNDGKITYGTGTGINEYSIDDTFGGDSDDAVPTEQAVKAYVDNSVAAYEPLLVNEAGLYAALNDVSLFLEDLVDDTTPQLGGDLDMNSKNIDFPSTADISDVKDEDNMASNSATMLATQQSIKKYVDDEVGGVSGGAPGGSDGYVQYNNSGAFGGDVDFFWDDTNNKLLIRGADGHASNWAILNIDSIGTSAALRMIAYDDTPTDDAGFFLYHRRGTRASPTAVQSGDELGTIHLGGGFGAGANDMFGSVAIIGKATENFSSGNVGGKLEFYTTDNASATRDLRMTIDQNGSLSHYGPFLLTYNDVGDSYLGARAHSDTASQSGILQVGKGRGTRASPTKVLSGNTLGQIFAVGRHDSSYGTGAAIKFIAAEDFDSSTDLGTGIEFYTCPIDSGTLVKRITIGQDGKVALGSGTGINEFSIDGTMTGDSDDAVPTEKAVKLYVDTEVGGVSGGAPGGSDTQFQWNDNGSFGGAATLIYGETYGYIGVGDATTPGFALHVKGDGSEAEDSYIVAERTTDNTSPPYFLARKIRGSSIVEDDDYVALFGGYGYDGNTFEQLACMTFEVDGDPGDGDMPGRIVFYTTPDGDNAWVKRMEIGRDGMVDVTSRGVRVSDETAFGFLQVITYNDTAAYAGHLYLSHARGTIDTPTLLTSGVDISVIASQGYYGAGWGVGAKLYTQTTEAWDVSGYGTKMIFQTVPNNSTTLTTALTLGQDQKATLASGTGINEFSIDGTMAGNSDDAIPTEKAIVTYISGLSGTPGGSDGYVQYNNGGSFGGEADFFWDDTNKRLGIGTDTPDWQVTVVTQDGSASVHLVGYGNNADYRGHLSLQHARGTEASPLNIEDDDLIGDVAFIGHADSGWAWGGQIAVYASETWDDSNRGAEMRFGTVANGTATAAVDRMILGNDGKLAFVIGTGVNEYSTDGTMGGNSDDAIPTEKAIVTYVSGMSGASPGGSDGYVQYNNGGSFGGEIDFFWDDTNDRLGLGTVTPDVEIEVVSDEAASPTIRLISYASGQAYQGTISLAHSRGTEASPIGCLEDDWLGVVSFGGWGTTVFGEGATIRAQTTQRWYDNQFGAELIFATRPVDGALTDRMTLGGAGKLAFTLGTAVNEFSIDGTFAGDSDDAVPTEKAVKTYVDSAGVGAAGANYQLQYYNGGSLGADAFLGVDPSNKYLGIGAGTWSQAIVSALNIIGNTDATTKITMRRYSVDADAAMLEFRSGRGSPSAGAHNDTGDSEGRIDWYGHVGTGDIWGARIEAKVEGVPATFYGLPTGLYFYTRPSTNTAPTVPLLRMRIDNTGEMYLGAGVGIDEFSSDGTMAGNSDDAVPTEAAIVTYVASEAVDPGSSDGAVQYNDGGVFGGDAAHFYWNDTDDRLGIGTNLPQTVLDIAGERSGDVTLTVTDYYTSSTDSGQIQLRHARGIESSPIALDNGDKLGIVSVQGHDGTAWGGGGYMAWWATEDWSVGNHGSEMKIYTTPDGSSSETFAMIINQDQHVGIGDDNPEFRLSIKGDSHTSSKAQIWDTHGGQIGLNFKVDQAGAAVEDGNLIGAIYCYGDDGTDYEIGGYMTFFVDGTVSTDDVPTGFALFLKEEGVGSVPYVALSIAHDKRIDIYGYLDINDNSIIMDGDVDDLTASGVIVEQQVDANGSGIGAALHMDTDSHWIEADADALTTMPCAGIALESGTGVKMVLLRGYYRDDTAFNFTIGGLVYMHIVTGDFTQTIPSGQDDWVECVGYAYTADILYFEPNFLMIQIDLT